LKQLLKFFWTLHSKDDKLTFFFSLFFPLLFSIILYIFSMILHPSNFFLINSLVISYSVLWLLTWLIILSNTAIFEILIKNNEVYQKNKDEIKETIHNLIKKRQIGKFTFPQLFHFSIFSIYFMELSTLLFFIKNDLYTFSYLFWISIIFLALFLNKIRNLSIGLQESNFATYNLAFSLIFSTFIWYALIFLNGSKIFQINNLNFNEIITLMMAFTSGIMLPIIILVIDKIYLRNRSGNKGRAVGWGHLINRTTLAYEFILLFLFVYFVLFLTTDVNLFSIGILANSMFLFSFFLFLLVFTIIILALIPSIFLRSYIDYFLRSITDWEKFFKTLFNDKNKDESPGKLIKIIGICKAVSINEKYKENFCNFNQHFLLNDTLHNQDIDIISLKEKNPIIGTKKIVNELNEIMLIGEMKYVLDDTTLNPNNNRISKLIIAYHVEDQKLLPIAINKTTKSS